MSDIRPWLEMELTRQLSPVTAPESLWRSIRTTPTKPRFGRGAWLLWPVAALMVFFASGEWPRAAELRDITQLTPQEFRAITNATKACDFWSDDPVEIRNWVKSKGNIDVDIPSERSGTVRLIGARLVRVRGTLVAAIAYRTANGAGDGVATLLVSNRRSGSKAPAEGHSPSRIGFPWRMQGQVSEIASAGTDAQGACLLCHL